MENINSNEELDKREEATIRLLDIINKLPIKRISTIEEFVEWLNEDNY